MATAKKMQAIEDTVPALNGDAYLALQGEAQELRALIEESLEDGLREDDLEQIKIPGGGGLQWELPNGENVATFDGVIVGIQTTRSYWPSEFSGGSTPPDCTSRDGKTGIGNPGGECEVCPLNHWGSGRNGKGTACSERKRVYILRPDDTFPTILSLPITSVKLLRKYRVSLIKHRKRLHEVVTQFSLARTKSTDGIAYSQAQFTSGGALPADMTPLAKAYAATIQAALGISTDQAQPVADPVFDPESTEIPVSDPPFGGFAPEPPAAEKDEIPFARSDLGTDLPRALTKKVL